MASVNYEDRTSNEDITIRFNKLPFTGNAIVSRYLIDATHSNLAYYIDAGLPIDYNGCNLQLLASYPAVVDSNGGVTMPKVTLGKSAVSLWVVTSAAAPSIGWKAKYYNNTTATGTPTGTRSEPMVNFDWSSGYAGAVGIATNSSQFSAVWTGTVTAPITGTYSFVLTSNLSRKLWVDNVAKIDQYTSVGTTVSSPLYLTAGSTHYLQVQFDSNTTGQATNVLSWEYHDASYTQNQPLQLIPTEKMVPGL